MAAQRGFCPFCAYVNPPDHKFCISCQKKLPDYPVAAARDVPHQELGEPTEPPELPLPKSTPWIILVLVVGISAVVVVAAVGLLPHLLAPNSGGGSSNANHRVLTDLCPAGGGNDCRGTLFQLPTIVQGVSENVSSCDAIYPTGSGVQLLLNFTSDSQIFGVVIPQTLYSSFTGSFSADPAGFFNNSTALSEAAWHSGPVSGWDNITAPLPTTSLNWCLGWWDPGGPATITLTNDLYLSAVPTS